MRAVDKFPGSAKGRHRLPFDVLYEDRDVIVIDKPADYYDREKLTDYLNNLL